METSMTATTGTSATSQTSSRRRALPRAHRLTRIVLAASVLASAGAVASTNEASAITLSGSGSAGLFFLNKTHGVADLPFLVRLVSGEYKVDRSPASSSTQVISVTWRVWSLRSGAWTLAANPTQTYSVAPGQRVVSSGWYLDSMPGIFSVDYTITWKTTGGLVLASRFIDYVHGADYSCGAGFLCQIYYYDKVGQHVISVS
jgi:hypothetical protein